MLAGVTYRILDRVVNRSFEVTFATLARRHSADDVGAVVDHFLRVEGADAPGETLHDDRGCFIQEYAHVCLP